VATPISVDQARVRGLPVNWVCIRMPARPRLDPLTFLGVCALKFNVVFEDAGDGWVYAHVQELPEVHTQGEGLEQARLMVREAIELVLEDRRERGEAIPATGWALVEPVEIAA